MDHKTKKWIKIALREPLYVSRLIQNKLRKKFLFDYHFLKGYSFHPYTVVIVPTYRCNLRCKMCNQYEGDYKQGLSQIVPGKDELTIDQWREVIDDVARWRPHINLFGGEPLLYKDIIALITHIKSKKLSCSIATNGILVGKYADAIVKSDMEAVNISIDGPQAINDLIRGRQDAFQKIIQGIRAIQDLKQQYHTTRPRIHLNCVITPWNYEYLSELVEIATDLGIDGLNFQHLMFVSEEINRANQKFFEKTFGYDPKLLDTFPVLSPEAIDTSRVSAELETFKRTAAIPIRFLPNLTPQDIPFYYEQLDYQFNNTMCIAPWIRATITPKGNVTPCIGYIIGNVLEQRFTKIWNSQRYRTFRAELQKRGIFPGCVRCCHRRY
jgi:MoaA/NifB/PqqE/SkfB family radical SAM enzyme